jgi:COP9 signalosome complex subunit 1
MQPTMKNIHPDDVCFNDVIAPQDIAVYGGLCALATFDRSELASKVIDDVAFKQFLELAPDARVLAVLYST